MHLGNTGKIKLRYCSGSPETDERIFMSRDLSTEVSAALLNHDNEALTHGTGWLDRSGLWGTFCNDPSHFMPGNLQIVERLRLLDTVLEIRELKRCDDFHSGSKFLEPHYHFRVMQ
jgi:hypothetical protein